MLRHYLVTFVLTTWFSDTSKPTHVGLFLQYKQAYTRRTLCNHCEALAEPNCHAAIDIPSRARDFFASGLSPRVSVASATAILIQLVRAKFHKTLHAPVNSDVLQYICGRCDPCACTGAESALQL